MRVIAGEARHLPLITAEGKDTRPTTDRIKETLFNMIAMKIPGCTFLDLFSGSGGIGIEALSRGAEEAVFVESDRKAAECIRRNLAFTHLESRATLYVRDVFGILPILQSHAPFDIIFMDPPYDRQLEKRTLELLSGSRLVSETTLMITEASLNTDFSYLEKLGLRIQRYKKYKTNAHVFIEKVY